jgi:hypothetical protein
MDFEASRTTTMSAATVNTGAKDNLAHIHMQFVTERGDDQRVG